MQATSAGQKDLEAQNMLEKKLKSGSSISYDETVQMAISVLQSVLSADFKATDIEVRIISFSVMKTVFMNRSHSG